MSAIYKPVSSSEKRRLTKVLAFYFRDLLKPEISLNQIGFINQTYLVKSRGERYILRQSNPAAVLNDLKFEVQLLRFLQVNKFPFTAKVISSLSGKNIVKRDGRYYTMQTFLPGRIIASWRDLRKYTLPVLREHFRASAFFTKTVRDFKPTIACRKPTVGDYLISWRKLFSQSFHKISRSHGRQLLVAARHQIDWLMQKTIREYKTSGFERLPKQLVHYDLHPGNFHFFHGKIVGMFDFDWARMDHRLVDLAATISQSCYYYGGPRHGRYRPNRINAGLISYRKAFGKSELTLWRENRLLKIALIGNNFSQLLVMMDWYAEHHKEKESGSYLTLFINLLMKNNYDSLFVS